MNDYSEDSWYETIGPEDNAGIAGRTNSNILQELKTFQTSRGSNHGGNSLPNSGEYVNVVTPNDVEYQNINGKASNASGTNDDYLEPVDYWDNGVYENDINQQMCQNTGLHDEVPNPVNEPKTPQQEKRRKCGNCCVGICVVVILLLLAGIGGGSFFLSKKFVDSSDDQGKQDFFYNILLF